MNEHISILQGYIDHLEYMKKNADDFFDREQADKDIEAFKAAIKALEQEPKLEPCWETCFECPLSHGCPKIKGCTNEQAMEYASKIPNDCPLSAQPERKPCEDAISREPFTDSTICEGISCNECSFNRKDKGGCILEERVMKLPSIQPKPKTGHWEWVQYDYNPKLGNWHCSECRCIVVECVDKEEKGGIPLYKYCPQCGAKMQEAEIEG